MATVKPPPTRAQDIKTREDAIKRKLEETNHKNWLAAQAKISSKTGGTKTYDAKVIDSGTGAAKGMSKSDYGSGSGAAIPYQVGTAKWTATKANPKAPKPKPPAKPFKPGTVGPIKQNPKPHYGSGSPFDNKTPLSTTSGTAIYRRLKRL
jgi:hypothetical protein